MRIAAIAFLVVTGIAVPAAAKVPVQFIAGTVVHAAAAGTCYTDGGFSNWRRTDPTADVLMAIPPVVYTAGSTSGETSYEVSGQTDLSFTSATAGNIFFLNSAHAGVSQAPFTNYTQTYTASAGRLDVSFQINLSGCVLTIAAVFFE